MLRPMRLLLFLLALPLLANAQSAAPWQIEPSETTADLRGVHAVGGGVVWASGSGGTVLRSQDSGFEWQQCETPPGAEKLDFRGIWAWDDQTAVVMSSGPGALSRLYRTTDGCAHWTLLYTNPDKDGFWDAIVFQNRQKAYLLGDPVGGKFVVLKTEDGGSSWTRSDPAGFAASDGAHGAFAASNSALLAGAKEQPMFGTGGGFIYSQILVVQIAPYAPGPPRASHAEERWDRYPTPLASSQPGAGIFSLGERPSGGFTRVAVGGDYSRPDDATGTAAWSQDGKRWMASTTPPGGYRSAVAWDADLNVWITAGPNGSDLSRDDGKTWQRIERAPADTPKGGEWNALSLPWAVGPHGRIEKLNAAALCTPAAAAR